MAGPSIRTAWPTVILCVPYAEAEKETFCRSLKPFAAPSGSIVGGEEKQEHEDFWLAG